MSPRAIARFAVCTPGPRTVSGATPTRSPADAAVSSRRRASSRSTPSGFSVHTCFPAATIASETATCAAGIVRFTTMSMSGSSSTTSTPPARGTPYAAACARARSSTRSPIARTTTSGKRVRFCRY